MNRIPWTFVRVSNTHDRKREFGEEYERAAVEGIRYASAGFCAAEFVHDEHLPSFLRGGGWWGKLALFDPECPFGSNGVIHFADLDTVFHGDLFEMMRRMEQVDRDVVGIADFGPRGGWESGIMRIRKGSPGALRVWAAIQGASLHPNTPDGKFIASAAGGALGYMPDELTASYKVEAGTFPLNPARKRGALARASVLCFHGWPKPHDVLADPGMSLHDFVKENWRPDG